MVKMTFRRAKCLAKVVQTMIKCVLNIQTPLRIIPLKLQTLILPWIKPNQEENTSPWAWHFWTPSLVLYYIAVVLITDKTAELYVPSTGASCTLPSLPDNRAYHTVTDGGLICGGDYTRDSCLLWSPDSGTWEEALTLDVEREYHVSWTPSSGTGTYLMGGFYSLKTTTLVNNDGSQEPGFPLKYDTK